MPEENMTPCERKLVTALDLLVEYKLGWFLDKYPGLYSLKVTAGDGNKRAIQEHQFPGDLKECLAELADKVKAQTVGNAMRFHFKED
jgi:hypothetical protein